MSYRIRKYSIAWWVKNAGVLLLAGAMFLAVGLSEAPEVPEEEEPEDVVPENEVIIEKEDIQDENKVDTTEN